MVKLPIKLEDAISIFSKNKKSETFLVNENNDMQQNNDKNKNKNIFEKPIKIEVVADLLSQRLDIDSKKILFDADIKYTIDDKSLIRVKDVIFLELDPPESKKKKYDEIVEAVNKEKDVVLQKISNANYFIGHKNKSYYPENNNYYGYGNHDYYGYDYHGYGFFDNNKNHEEGEQYGNIVEYDEPKISGKISGVIMKVKKHTIKYNISDFGLAELDNDKIILLEDKCSKPVITLLGEVGRLMPDNSRIIIPASSSYLDKIPYEEISSSIDEIDMMVSSYLSSMSEDYLLAELDNASKSYAEGISADIDIWDLFKIIRNRLIESLDCWLPEDWNTSIWIRNKKNTSLLDKRTSADDREKVSFYLYNILLRILFTVIKEENNYEQKQ